jgi:hypothetical protein
MGMEGVEHVDVDGKRLREGECLWRNGSKLETESLHVCPNASVMQFHVTRRKKKRDRMLQCVITPLTMRVPTRVMVPLTRSLRGVLMTSVLPGSTGARSA